MAEYKWRLLLCSFAYTNKESDQEEEEKKQHFKANSWIAPYGLVFVICLEMAMAFVCE